MNNCAFALLTRRRIEGPRLIDETIAPCKPSSHHARVPRNSLPTPELNEGNARRAADAFIASAPAYPDGRFHGLSLIHI